MSTSGKYAEVTGMKSLRVQDLKTKAFEGLYITSRLGDHGRNYIFLSEGAYVQIYGSKALHERMIKVTPGREVKITYLREHQLQDGKRFHEVRVEQANDVAEGFDMSAHLKTMGEA